MTSTVFIGIPTINRPNFVRETVASLLEQSFADFHCIVSDNGSDPKAIESVEQYIEKLGDSRFRFFRQPRNDGEYGQARFFFRESADAEYFMILHDDDIVCSRYLETGVRALAEHADTATFVANPFLMNQDGIRSKESTQEYLRSHGRNTIPTGEIDVLQQFMTHGFLPISGTLFRRSALLKSGFVDNDAVGNYPFECDVFLRLGATGAKGWYEREELLGFRFHSGSMRNYMGLMNNPRVVDSMIRMFSAYSFDGIPERRRKILLSRLHRARAIIDLRNRDGQASRTSLLRALRCNRSSIKAWALTPFILTVPGICSKFLRAPQDRPDAPALNS